MAEGRPFPDMSLEEWAQAIEVLVLFDMYGLETQGDNDERRHA